MTRRAPPTALRLIPGPTPPRNHCRHTLPSVPRPTFHEPSFVARAPSQTRQRRSPPQIEEAIPMLSVVIPAYPHAASTPTPISASASTSSSSSASFYTSSASASPTSDHISRSNSFSPSSRHSPFSSSYSSPSTSNITRGPWDHSGSIPLAFNVETVLKPLEPVAMGIKVSAGRC